jgi:hypothetical protein
LSGTSAILAFILTLGVTGFPITAWAQDGWRLESDLGVSLYFGASKQNIVRTEGDLDRDAGTWITTFNYGFDYGEATEPGRDSFVSKRSWNLGGAVDLRELRRVSPFFFADGTGSFEKQIDLRLRSGIGARYRFFENDATDDSFRLDLSLAGLIDRTDPRAVPGNAGESTTAARLSARLRAGRDFSRVDLDLTVFYQPSVETFDDYLFDVSASVGLELNDNLALEISIVDEFDSFAVMRGAAANNDGLLIVSLRVTLPGERDQVGL